MIDYVTLYTDGVMCTGASGVTAEQKMKIKALWSWCRHEYELIKRNIDVTMFNAEITSLVLQSNKQNNNKRNSGKNRKQ